MDRIDAVLVKGATPDTCTIETLCRICGKRHTTALPVSADSVIQWYGERAAGLDPPLIQCAFPTLTPAQRETMISGSHSECFDRLFGGDEA